MPLSAIQPDETGMYRIFTVETTAGIFGMENTVKAVKIEILESNANYAAVSGLPENAPIVVYTDKSLMPQDKAQVVNSNEN